MIKKHLEKIIVIAIILISFFVKVYQLDKSPPSVNFDEAALGYNTYSLLKTGKDEYGNFLPLSLRSFNDYKPALYAYLSIPFVGIMGLNEISIRMVSVLAGTISILFLSFFLKEFVKNKYLRLFILLVLAFQPWRIHFSRVALEANLSAAFFLIGSWFLYKSTLEKESFIKKLRIPFFFALSAYSYHGARAAVPALLVLFLFDPFKFFFIKNFKEYKKWFGKSRIKYLKLLLVFILFLSPVFLVNKSSQVLTRLRQENVFYRYYPFTPKELIQENSNVWLNLKNNPIYYFLGIMVGHMLSYFSPINLGGRVFHWVRGSVQYIPGFSMFEWLAVIVFVFGLVFLIKNFKKDFKYRFLIYWILAGAAPAALTWNWFHPLRSMNIYSALEIIIALGFLSLFTIFKKKLSKKLFKLTQIALVFLLALTMLFTVLNEYNYSVSENHGEYQPGGFKRGIPILADLQDDYDEIIIDSPHAQSYIFFLFYQSFPPEIVQSYADQRPAPGIEGNLDFDFYKYKFEKYDWPQQRNKSKVIVWTTSEVLEEEINNTPGAKLIWVSNPVKEEALAIIVKD